MDPAMAATATGAKVRIYMGTESVDSGVGAVDGGSNDEERGKSSDCHGQRQRQ